MWEETALERDAAQKEEKARQMEDELRRLEQQHQRDVEEYRSAAAGSAPPCLPVLSVMLCFMTSVAEGKALDRVSGCGAGRNVSRLQTTDRHRGGSRCPDAHE